MFVELHMIQNFAPSCLNRDDTNSPKDCEFGGFRRARISSQCLKRAIRQHPLFANTVGAAIGVRTKRFAIQLIEALGAQGREEAEEVVKTVTEPAFGALAKENKTSYLLYLNGEDVAQTLQQIVERWDDLTGKAKDKKEAAKSVAERLKQRLVTKPFPPDMALFGRMVADAPETNVDAACQVAHALSTHKVSMEMDYYTAVDDLKPDDTAGADMIGTVEFNSSCFYRYALIDTAKLLENLGGDAELARQTVEGFIRAAVAAIPTGKQNSMAAQNRPSFVFAVVRDGGCPASLANAFENPVRIDERNPGLVVQSVVKLADHWDRLSKAYGEADVTAKAFFSLEEPEDGFVGLADARVDGLEQVIASVDGALAGGG